MFTGLIEDVGKVVAAHATEHGAQLEIAAPGTAKQVRAGQSIAVNGCCLTLTSRRADGRLGGHFVQGHVDCVSRIMAFDKKGPDFRLEIELPKEFAPYVASKASIAVNGISLTVADILPK